MKKQNNAIIGIYKIINPKGKVYIGQSIDVFKRKKHYKYMNSIGNIVYNSIKKYGWENHTHEIIEECFIEQLNEKETYWKQYYLDQVKGDWKQVMFCSLYDFGGGPKSIEFKNILKNIWSSKSIEEKEVINLKRREGNLGKKKPGSGYRNQSKEDIEKLIQRSPFNQSDWGEKCKKSIYMLDKTTKNILKEFGSVTEASYIMGISQGSISCALTGRSKTSCGFIWIYK